MLAYARRVPASRWWRSVAAIRCAFITLLLVVAYTTSYVVWTRCFAHAQTTLPTDGPATAFHFLPPVSPRTPMGRTSRMNAGERWLSVAYAPLLWIDGKCFRWHHDVLRW